MLFEMEGERRGGRGGGGGGADSMRSATGSDDPSSWICSLKSRIFL